MKRAWVRSHLVPIVATILGVLLVVSTASYWYSAARTAALRDALHKTCLERQRNTRQANETSLRVERDFILEAAAVRTAAAAEARLRGSIREARLNERAAEKYRQLAHALKDYPVPHC